MITLALVPRGPAEPSDFNEISQIIYSVRSGWAGNQSVAEAVAVDAWYLKIKPKVTSLRRDMNM